MPIAITITENELDGYSSDYYDLVDNGDGTFTLYPLKWVDQASWEDYQYGCGEYLGIFTSQKCYPYVTSFVPQILCC